MDLVQRLHERLVTALGASSPAPDDDHPVTIGDLYQRLIPYRLMRTELGVMELAAYEHALLRLLSGEGGYVEATSAHALAEIGRELASVNPILGIYRDFADVPVRVSQPDRGGAAPPAPRDPPPSADLPLATSSGPPAPAPHDPPDVGQPPDELPAEVGAGDPAFAARPRASEAEREGEACASCGETLPALAGLRFCPYCGTAPPPKPCARCGTPLEVDWNFCIRCGTPVHESSAL